VRRSLVSNPVGAEVVGRVSPQSVSQAQSLGLSQAVDVTKALPAALDGSFDVGFDANGSLSVREGNRLIRSGGKVVDIAPSKLKFLLAVVLPSRKFVFADVEVGSLQQVVDLVAGNKLMIKVAKTISLAEAPAMLKSLGQGSRLNGKAVTVF
jgi:NADPH:quinone reductase-like Zn-dependent oxidoreductase